MKLKKNIIIIMLNKIADLYVYKSKINKNEPTDLGRSRAFYNAAENLKSYIGNYNYEDLHKAGIGGNPTSSRRSSTIDEIIEIYQTGNSERLNELMEHYGEKVFPQSPKNKSKLAIIELFKSIPYIGDKKANELADAGYKTMKDLENDDENLLTKSQKIFVEYNDKIANAISKEQMINFQSQIKDKFNCANDIETPKKNQFRWTIAGSFRRNNSVLKDLDLLVLDQSIDKILELLDEIVFKIIKKGDIHASILAKFENMDEFIKMDIVSVENKAELIKMIVEIVIYGGLLSASSFAGKIAAKKRYV